MSCFYSTVIRILKKHQRPSGSADALPPPREPGWQPTGRTASGAAAGTAGGASRPSRPLSQNRPPAALCPEGTLGGWGSRHASARLRPPQLKAGVTVAEEGQGAENAGGSGRDLSGTEPPCQDVWADPRFAALASCPQPPPAPKDALSQVPFPGGLSPRPERHARDDENQRLSGSLCWARVTTPQSLVPKVKCNAQGHASGNGGAGFKPRNGLGAGGFFLVS